MMISDKTQEANFRVTELVARKMKPPTVGEDLILPACYDVRILLGEDAAIKFFRYLCQMTQLKGASM